MFCRLVTKVLRSQFIRKSPLTLAPRSFCWTLTSATGLCKSPRWHGEWTCFVLQPCASRQHQKKGVSIFVKVVEPIFRAAGCGLDVICTTLFPISSTSDAFCQIRLTRATPTKLWRNHHLNMLLSSQFLVTVWSTKWSTDFLIMETLSRRCLRLSPLYPQDQAMACPWICWELRWFSCSATCWSACSLSRMALMSGLQPWM